MKTPKLEIRSPKQARSSKSGISWESALLPLFCFIILHSSFCLCASAQTNYTVDWYSVDGGGGTSTGGVYSVSGTIGQPDAGAMSGGNYTLEGGFWGIIAAVQTPGAPLLSVWRTTTNTAVVSWPSPSIGFSLYQNTNLNTTNWISPPETINDNGTNKFIVVNPPAGNRFYRLKNNIWIPVQK